MGFNIVEQYSIKSYCIERFIILLMYNCILIILSKRLHTSLSEKYLLQHVNNSLLHHLSSLILHNLINELKVKKR